MDDIHFWVEWTIGEGNLEAFKTLADEIAERISDEEPGTKTFRSFLSEDERKCHIYVWYEDSSAVVAHSKGSVATELLPRLGDIAQPTRFEIHGDLSAEAAEAVIGGSIYRGLGGFLR